MSPSIALAICATSDMVRVSEDGSVSQGPSGIDECMWRRLELSERFVPSSRYDDLFPASRATRHVESPLYGTTRFTRLTSEFSHLLRLRNSSSVRLK
jgi:hypothetical protein